MVYHEDCIISPNQHLTTTIDTQPQPTKTHTDSQPPTRDEHHEQTEPLCKRREMKRRSERRMPTEKWQWGRRRQRTLPLVLASLAMREMKD